MTRRFTPSLLVVLPLLLTLGCSHSQQGQNDQVKTYTSTASGTGSSVTNSPAKPGGQNQQKGAGGAASGAGNAQGPPSSSNAVGGNPTAASDNGQPEATQGQSVMNPGAPPPPSKK